MTDWLIKEEVNLLPPPALAARVRRLYRKRFASINRRIVVSLLFVYAALGIVLALTWQNKQQLGQAQGDRGTASQELQETVRNTNQLIDAFHRELTSRQTWTSLVEGLVQAMPPQVQLRSLEVKEDTLALEIRAIATSRAAVLDMQRIAENLPGIERVEAPLRNFAVGVDGEFSLILYPEQAAEKTPSHE